MWPKFRLAGRIVHHICCSGVLAVCDPALPAPHHVRGGRPPLQVYGRGKPAGDGIQVITSRPVELV
jgi:hypothetical protein